MIKKLKLKYSDTALRRKGCQTYQTQSTGARGEGEYVRSVLAKYIQQNLPDDYQYYYWHA